MKLIDLVVKGYFPEEILPPFTSEDLAIVLDPIIINIDILDPIAGRAKRILSKVVNYSTPKIKAYRRELAIPNPLHHIRLSHTIVNNWADISSHCNRSNISLSKLKIGSSRALLKPSFNVATREKVIRSTGYRYLLKIDIAKCYASIYTHSIPWALHSKTASKASRTRPALYGNALDEDCRKMQDGQTIGIPIGPDTSRVISEIVLSSIDLEIESKLHHFAGIRVIDDYHLYFKNLGDLEVARAVIHKSLKEFELELNQSKEKQVGLPELIESEWFSVIREFRFRNKWEHQRKDLITFFDTVTLYSQRYPDDLVFTYAMSKLRFTVFSRKNWNIFQSLMLNALLVEPKVLPYIAQNILSYGDKGYRLNYSLISDTLEELINYHLALNNDFEITWSLWILKKLNINLSESTAKVLSENMNSIVILTALDLQTSGLIPSGLDTTRWTALLSKDNLYSEYWLVAYEAYIKGWLRS
jgi:hypothetical protein